MKPSTAVVSNVIFFDPLRARDVFTTKPGVVDDTPLQVLRLERDA